MMNLRNLSNLKPGISSRLVSSSPVIFEKAPTSTKPPNPNEPVAEPAESVPLSRVSNFDKKILVWTKKFKTIDEIPSTVRYIN